MCEQAKPWISDNARVLVIGHDPRLQKSDTFARYAFFADYFFKPIPTSQSERAKYNLAASIFSCIGYLTSYQIKVDEISITNLCNCACDHAPKGKTVLIPEEKAIQGLEEIRAILNNSNIEIIFSMSQQVNYWLQKLGFCSTDEDFLKEAELKEKGLRHDPPYYEANKGRAFTRICGEEFSADNQYKLFPILHVKNWPLKGPFKKAYEKGYINCVNSLKSIN
ncbi:hypothetical protein JW835_05610 [bacterium]|nr:hypothetical protein [bacterium]